ncbi:MAG TPA: sensor histidine kinase KdpD [Phycisphaerae bacterium]|nr:sensor histidine kinase KdpD [Phycisphaerae bacterium]
MADQRPDPDALLARVRAEQRDQQRGRLKIFFGACAGVGKTYAMLEAARKRRADGADVVAGYVETHGRKETDVLLEGLEVLPSRWVDYRGIRLREFDLDAALQRKPALILVDELAHTNAEGLRHAKRWQDVIELLDSGIDVYSTVNVQHIESLNDIVAQITGILVRETIPDSVIERADEIELVDLPPDDLLQRLREGKVYIPEQAERAAANFFRRESLVALRELALRETADRVNVDVEVARRGHAAGETWPTTERLLVCVGPSPLSARVVRIARRMAARLHAEWLAVYVETPSRSASSVESLAAVRRNLRLAERLGAETATLTGERVAEEIVAFARRRNVSKIVIGKSERPRWRDLLFGSVVDDLIRHSGDIEVHVVKGAPEEQPRPAARLMSRKVNWTEYFWAACVTILSTAVARLMWPHFSPVNLTMVYLLGVAGVAARFSSGPAIFASVLSIAAFDYLFVPPFYRFAVADAQYLVTFAVMLIIAILISTLTQRNRRQAVAVRTRYLRTIALYFMSRQLAAAPDTAALMRVAGRHIADVFEADTVILLPQGDGALMPQGGTSPAFVDSPNERGAAEWVFHHQNWAGRGTDTLPSVQGIYLPLVASERSLGVLGLRPRQPDYLLEPDQRHMLETFATQLAIALERTQFAEQAERARLQAEAEQMRSTLLSSVSHDLRTPLATITGAASALLDDPAGMAERTRRELLTSICDESARLNQLVGNLLEMTRLESGSVQLHREWYPLEEVVGSALTRMEKALSRHKVETSLPADLPLVYVDGVLLEQVFTNLLENAARYTPAGTTIRIVVQAQPDRMLVEVLDEGSGLQRGTECDVFRKFYRDQPATDRTGSGLGLAICLAIVRLHQGEIGAENRPTGGARFWFTLPRSPAPPMLDNPMTAGEGAAASAAAHPKTSKPAGDHS